MEASPDNGDERIAEVAVVADATAEAVPAGAPPPLPATPPKPYAGFSEDDFAGGDFEKIPPLQALIEDGEIAGYLKHGNPAARWDKSRLARSLAGLAGTAALLLAFYLLPGWTMLRHYAPSPPSPTPKPAEYDGDIPLQLGDGIRDLNAAIRAGNKWTAVFDKFRALVAEMAASPVALPAAAQRWAYTETLVAMASGEVSPDQYPPSYPDEIFAKLNRLTEASPGQPVPYRADCAYAAILHAALADGPDDRAGEDKLLLLLDRIRSDYADLLDDNRELLAIEAEQHIRAFPPEYRENDRRLAYHWRRAAHAIQRLYALADPGDMLQKKIDRERWQAIHRYFDFTLLTLDWRRVGRVGKVSLDGEEYTRGDVLSILRDISTQ